MNKLDLVNELAKKASILKAESRFVVDLFFESIVNTLSRGDRVEIRGLCSFTVKDYRSFVGRNPKTGEKVDVGSKKLPRFKCGGDLKRRVNFFVKK